MSLCCGIQCSIGLLCAPGCSRLLLSAQGILHKTVEPSAYQGTHLLSFLPLPALYCLFCNRTPNPHKVTQSTFNLSLSLSLLQKRSQPNRQERRERKGKNKKAPRARPNITFACKKKREGSRVPPRWPNLKRKRRVACRHNTQLGADQRRTRARSPPPR